MKLCYMFGSENILQNLWVPPLKRGTENCLGYFRSFYDDIMREYVRQTNENIIVTNDKKRVLYSPKFGEFRAVTTEDVVREKERSRGKISYHFMGDHRVCPQNVDHYVITVNSSNLTRFSKFSRRKGYKISTETDIKFPTAP